ncbi:MAG: DUF2726 domain-containing protein [Nitrospira sp.]|nr:DUF2726 domain-containing protein [Nitrospira sp.]
MDFIEELLERLLEWLPPDWLPLDSHAPHYQTLVVGLIVVAGFVVVVVLVRLGRRKRVNTDGMWIDEIGEHVSAMARPLMDGPDVSMFNLLLLAVRDHFLLLSKISLRSLVQLRVEDDAFKRVVAQHLRHVTVDFVLVHPGTRLPVKAIFVRKPEDDPMTASSQERLVEAVFQKAGIEVIRLDQEVRYSVERLTNLLGLDEDM